MVGGLEGEGGWGYVGLAGGGWRVDWGKKVEGGRKVKKREKIA